ncbi:MAG: isoprenylcysteine carboxylmethyltransferase family protein [Thermodesulfobacteriota bacterium]
MSVERFVVTGLLWGVWCLLHSLLTRDRTLSRTGVADTWVGRYYGLAYSAVATATLGAVYRLTPREGEAVLFEWDGWTVVVPAAAWLLAVTVMCVAFRTMGASRLLGLHSRARPEKLITHGVYGIVRHPQYASGLLMLWCRDIRETDLAMNLVLTPYLFLGAGIEERRLTAEFGQDYKRYMARVPGFFPVIFRTSPNT